MVEILFICDIISRMKQLSDSDIAQMIGLDFTPDVSAVRNSVRRQLHLSTRIPMPAAPVPKHATLDLHQHTIEDAWEKIMSLATSGVRSATIITGASGVLKQLFPQWATESLLAPYIISYSPVNNGSFSVRFHKIKPDTGHN